MKHILFVDDEPNIIEALRRMLFPLRKEWNMSFCSGASEALAAMEQQRFDVIVSDMRMPGMDGAQLLAEVKTRYPDTVRFILTGQTDGGKRVSVGRRGAPVPDQTLQTPSCSRTVWTGHLLCGSC